MKRAFDVFCQLELPQNTCDFGRICLAGVCHLCPYLLQHFCCDVFAFSSLQLSEDLFEVILFLAVSLWLCHVVVEVCEYEFGLLESFRILRTSLP